MSEIKSLPKIAETHSIKINVEAGKKYYWCTCGLSNHQPFCDSSHIGSNFLPIVYEATESKLVGFCGCKHSNNPPFCDGSHKSLIVT